MEKGVLQKRFVIVAGKGGVGKSTVCAALGVAAARAGRRVVVAELNTREKTPHFFGKRPSGYTAREVFPNLHSINIRPDLALREYGIKKLKFEKIFEVIFQNAAMKRLMQMVPGMTELLLLGKAFDMERDTDRRGRPVWDMVIVDAPATGHGVSLFRLPQVILEAIESGPMYDDALAMRQLLEDPRRTAINLVSLAEDLPVKETLELQRQVETVLRIPKGFLLVNQVWPNVVAERDLTVLRTLRDAAEPPDELVAGAVSCVEALDRRRRSQERYLRELVRKVDMPVIKLPYLFRREFDEQAIVTLADHITREAERAELHRQTA